MGLFVLLGLFERGQLRFSQDQPVLRYLRFKRFQALAHRGKVMPLPDAAYTRG